MMEDDRPIWGIHMDWKVSGLPIAEGFIAIGWGAMGDLSKISPSREAFKKKVAEVYSNNIKPGAIPVVAGTLFKFVHEMKVGDLVIYPSKSDRMVNLGTIGSEYFHITKEDGLSYPNRRQVKWVRKVERPKFSQTALHEIGSAVTLFQVKNNSDEFTSAFEGQPLQSQDVDEETGGAAAAIAEEEIEDFVLKRLTTGLSHRQFEFFVAHLLERMGYHCRVTAATADGGVDIIAHKDELGFEDVVKVQCKQTLASVGQPQVAQLYGHVQDNEHGLFVTLGGYSAPAVEFERANQNLRLISGDELVKLIFRHYERFEPRYRVLLPMKRAYVPASVSDD